MFGSCGLATLTFGVRWKSSMRGGSREFRTGSRIFARKASQTYHGYDGVACVFATQQQRVTPLNRASTVTR